MPPEDVYADRDTATAEVEEVETETETTEDDKPDKKKGDDDGDDKSSESATGLLSKSFFGDKELKVGTKCQVKITRIFDDQLQVEYVPHGKKDSDSDNDDDDKPKESDDIYD